MNKQYNWKCPHCIYIYKPCQKEEHLSKHVVNQRKHREVSAKVLRDLLREDMV